MSQRKSPTGTAKRVVWRISPSNPQGGFVDLDALPHEILPAEPRDPSTPSGWMVSSFELMHGADIIEGPDTVPDDLFDELFPPAPVAQKKPEAA